MGMRIRGGAEFRRRRNRNRGLKRHLDDDGNSFRFLWPPCDVYTIPLNSCTGLIIDGSQYRKLLV